MSETATTERQQPERSTVKVRNPLAIALVRELLGPGVALTEDNVAMLLTELRRRRGDDATANAERPSTLEAAAGALLSVMDQHHQDQVKDVAFGLTRPAWVIMLGAVARMADNRELPAGEFSPEWLNRTEDAKPQVSLPRCERCHQEIPGGRRNQRFCCSRHGSDKDAHSEDCPLVVKAA